jgi:hypothetical protein
MVVNEAVAPSEAFGNPVQLRHIRHEDEEQHPSDGSD